MSVVPAASAAERLRLEAPSLDAPSPGRFVALLTLFTVYHPARASHPRLLRVRAAALPQVAVRVVADRLDQELDMRIDARQPREQVHAAQAVADAGGSTVKCRYGQRNDHQTELCRKRPRACAEKGRSAGRTTSARVVRAPSAITGVTMRSGDGLGLPSGST